MNCILLLGLLVSEVYLFISPASLSNVTGWTKIMSVDLPPPPPPPPALTAPVPSKRKLYQAIAEGKAPVEGDFEEARLLLTQRESRHEQPLN